MINFWTCYTCITLFGTVYTFHKPVKELIIFLNWLYFLFLFIHFLWQSSLEFLKCVSTMIHRRTTLFQGWIAIIRTLKFYSTFSKVKMKELVEIFYKSIYFLLLKFIAFLKPQTRLLKYNKYNLWINVHCQK
jgi:hypothetical protein